MTQTHNDIIASIGIPPFGGGKVQSRAELNQVRKFAPQHVARKRDASFRALCHHTQAHTTQMEMAAKGGAFPGADGFHHYQRWREHDALNRFFRPDCGTRIRHSACSVPTMTTTTMGSQTVAAVQTAPSAFQFDVIIGVRLH